MSEQLSEILKRTGSTYFAKLWVFYRNFFNADSSCLEFFYNCFTQEPLSTTIGAKMVDAEKRLYQNDNGEIYCEDVFIPRRMINAVERFVNTARDMEQIRRGKDVFKVVFLVTCVETLQQLRKPTSEKKKDLLFRFFEENISEEDKAFIQSRFKHDDEDSKSGEDSFHQFVGVLGEYRNCAAHEGDYWDYCFNNNESGIPTQLIVKIDLENYSMKNKKEHVFETGISYKEFESIFARTCISFIQKYVGGIDDADA